MANQYGLSSHRRLSCEPAVQKDTRCRKGFARLTYNIPPPSVLPEASERARPPCVGSPAPRGPAGSPGTPPAPRTRWAECRALQAKNRARTALGLEPATSCTETSLVNRPFKRTLGAGKGFAHLPYNSLHEYDAHSQCVTCLLVSMHSSAHVRVLFSVVRAEIIHVRRPSETGGSTTSDCC